MSSESSQPDRSRRGRGSPDPRRYLRRSVTGAAALGAAMLLLGSLRVGGSADSPETRDPALAAASDVPLAELPLEINERVRYWVERFTTDEKPSFQRFLAREGVYGPLIRQKLRARGMPEDLLYLAMIESGFSTVATSPVSAVGLWQFMGPTARQYGLRVDSWVDERRDPIKATDAALDYLSMLQARYDSWYLAAAAYNAGPGRVDRALRRLPAAERRRAGRDEDLYWEIQQHLPKETREYVPRMLAAMLLARRALRVGLEADSLRPYEFDRVWVPGGTRLALVARALGERTATLRDLNPHLIQGRTPPGASYALRVPVGSTPRVVAALGGASWRGPARVDDD